MSELLWCEECQSRHTKEFGDEFHGRLLAPRCNHIPGEGCTLVTAADGCSLECTVCREIVVELELVSVVVGEDDIEWVL